MCRDEVIKGKNEIEKPIPSKKKKKKSMRSQDICDGVLILNIYVGIPLNL